MGVPHSLVFLRWWKAWLVAVEKPTHIHFISMETFAAHVIADHAMILLVLIFAARFPDKPFAPWLFGSDQCTGKHFLSEMRSFCINQPDWTVHDLVPLVQRFIHMNDALCQAGSHLPRVVSARGYARSNYVPSSPLRQALASPPSASASMTSRTSTLRRFRMCSLSLSPLVVRQTCMPAAYGIGRRLRTGPLLRRSCRQRSRRQRRRSSS